VLRIAPRGLVRLDIGVGHGGEGRHGRDLGGVLVGKRVDLVLYGLAQVDVLLARLCERKLRERPSEVSRSLPPTL
jgi:hypothetical protein